MNFAKLTLLFLTIFLITSEAFAFNKFSFNQKYESEWIKYKEDYDKKYQNSVQEIRAFKNFIQNLKEIKKHNSAYRNGLVLDKKALNQFSDLSKSEFNSQYNTYKKASFDELKKHRISFAERNFKLPSLLSIPTSINYTQMGYVNPIQNQAQCGSCWTFSTTATLESQIFRATGKLIKLSEQNLIDCDTSNAGCGGGNVDRAFAYIQSNGIANSSVYPYTSGTTGIPNSQCLFNSKNNVFSQLNLNIKGIIDLPSNETVMQQFLAEYGPISVAICASTIQSYSGGIVNTTCNTINHAVTIVGYGIQSGVNYWIVRNSWGSGWGENGYFRLIMNHNALQIAVNPSYAYLRTQDAPTASVLYPQCNLGCYNNPNRYYFLPGIGFQLRTDSTFSECVSKCSNYLYAGLQGQMCFCQNIYYPYGKANTSDSCLAPCYKNPSVLCGSDISVSIYNVSCTLAAISGTTQPVSTSTSKPSTQTSKPTIQTTIKTMPSTKTTLQTTTKGKPTTQTKKPTTKQTTIRTNKTTVKKITTTKPKLNI